MIQRKYFRCIAGAALKIRVWNLNRLSGVSITNPRFISCSAKFQMSPDGFACGGTIDIGRGACFSNSVILAPFGGYIKIGTNIYIGPYSVLYGHGGLTIGNDVMIASHVTIVPANHGFLSVDHPIRTQASIAQGIIIMDDVWIGTGARILDGVTIGKGCVVGAGAVVTRSLPDYAVATGVPARIARTRVQSNVGDFQG